MLSHYTSAVYNNKKSHAFVVEVQRLIRQLKKPAMTVKSSLFFSAEPAVNVAMLPNEGGVVAWSQAEILFCGARRFTIDI